MPVDGNVGTDTVGTGTVTVTLAGAASTETDPPAFTPGFGAFTVNLAGTAVTVAAWEAETAGGGTLTLTLAAFADTDALPEPVAGITVFRNQEANTSVWLNARLPCVGVVEPVGRPPVFDQQCWPQIRLGAFQEVVDIRSFTTFPRIFELIA